MDTSLHREVTLLKLITKLESMRRISMARCALDVRAKQEPGRSQQSRIPKWGALHSSDRYMERLVKTHRVVSSSSMTRRAMT